MTLADRVVVMRAGRIEQVGSPEDVYEAAAHATFLLSSLASRTCWRAPSAP